VSSRGCLRPLKISAGTDRQTPQESGGEATKPFNGCFPAARSVALLEDPDLIANMDRSGDEWRTANSKGWFEAVNCHVHVL